MTNVQVLNELIDELKVENHALGKVSETWKARYFILSTRLGKATTILKRLIPSEDQEREMRKELQEFFEYDLPKALEEANDAYACNPRTGHCGWEGHKDS